MNVETTKMSSKGQIVIPLEIREEIKASEGTIFAIISGQDCIVLKKISTPSKEELLNELNLISIQGKKKLSDKGFTEKDLKKSSRIK